MADVSSYNSDQPSGNSEIRLGDDTLRSRGSDMHAAWTEEHFFRDGSAASGGVHKPGSSRVSFGNGPAINAGDEGRLFYDVDDNFLVVQGSSATTVVDAPIDETGARVEPGNLDGASGQNLPSGSFTTVEFENSLFDNGGFFTPSSNSTSLVVPSGKSGTYHIDMQAQFREDTNNNSFATGSPIALQVNVNAGADGDQFSDRRNLDANNGTNTLRAGGIQELSDGDRIWAEIRHDTGSVRTVGESFTYLAAERLD